MSNTRIYMAVGRVNPFRFYKTVYPYACRQNASAVVNGGCLLKRLYGNQSPLAENAMLYVVPYTGTIANQLDCLKSSYIVN